MPEGNIGLVTQSGAFGGLSSMMATDRGVGFRHVLTTGNEGDVGVADCLDYLVEDPGTEVILLYIEGVRDGPAFLDALARAREAAAKAVQALESGLTLELVAMDLRISVGAVGEIVGQTATDDLLDSIFSQFCLGK